MSKADAPTPDTEPTTQHERSAEPVDAEGPPRLPFPVVAIGASAGGLEAVSALLDAMHANTGMAFILVQHLPPDRESMMAEILSKRTDMRVLQVEDGMPIEVDHLYVIRPGYTLTIRDGRLRLGERVEKPGHHRPVDDLFKSLAEEQRERAIAIILSGMGSNGSAGAQAIKAVGGLCIAQEPDSAQFPSMPRHVIDAGYADFILHPQDMPNVLVGYAGHPYARGDREAEVAARDQNYLREVLSILHTRTRTDFSGYKKPTVIRRIQRRMGLMRITRMRDYAKHLRQSPSEVTALADDLLIHVTGFFRDPEAWEVLRETVIAPLVASRSADAPIRCWVTACSSGEEAYTLAMLLVEELDRTGRKIPIKVFATDMAERSLANARAGLYPGGIESEITPQRLDRFFVREDAVYRVSSDLRERVVFAPQNVLQDPPFSRLDIVSCRNLLIYLEPEVQQQVLSLLHFGLREGGALFLGNSETVGADGLFEAVDKRARIFRRMGKTRHGSMNFPLPHATRPGGVAGDRGDRSRADTLAVPRSSYLQMTHRALLDHHTPAAVLIDREHRIVYFHGNTKPFLEQPPGEPTRDLFKMSHDGIRAAARMALQRAAAEGIPSTVADGSIEIEPGRSVKVAVTASPVGERGRPDFFVVSFIQRTDDSPSHAAEDEGSVATQELRLVKGELQNTIEALQTSNEELKASNEEVTSMNEELQSSNEELETSKEEMQSLNEELTTVNAQLQTKMEELQSATNDLTSLLTSTNIAVLFLDQVFRIRRFTPAMKDLLDLLASDVGRPLTDLSRKFDDPNLIVDAKAVLAKLVPIEREVPVEGDRWFLRRVLPYRTVDNRIDGVVVMFIDVTERRVVAQALAEQSRLLDLSHDAIVIRDTEDRITYWSRGATELYGWSAEQALGKRYSELLNTQYDRPLSQLMDELRTRDGLTGEVTQTTRTGERLRVLCRWSLDRDSRGEPGSLLISATDITDRERTHAAMRDAAERLRLIADLVPDLLWQNNPQGVTEWYNRRWLEYTGQTMEEAAGYGWLAAVHPDDRAQSKATFQRAVDQGEPLRQEHRIRAADGSYRWFLVQALPLRDSSGQIVNWFGAATDIDDQRNVMASLRETEERFRLVVEGARDYAIFMLDPDRRISMWNTGAERVLGWAESEVIGKPADLIFTPEDRATDQPAIEMNTALREGKAADLRWHLRKDGSRFWADGVMHVLRDELGRPRGFVKVLRDETHRKEAADELQAAMAAAEAASTAKDEFLAILSHELRTPLAAILLWARMLRDRAATPEQIEEGVQAITSSAEAQRQLIDDLLDTSRITSGKLRIHMRELELLPFVRESVDAIKPTADAKGIEVHAQAGPGIDAVHADPDRLRQVIWNLLTNAVKFTPTGGRVDVSVQRVDDVVEIRVTDTGEGIPADFLPHVFDSFRQADSSTTRRHGGLGLGLAIVKRLVEMHGGTIQTFSSGPGKGATFSVRLPRIQKSQRAASKRAPAALKPPASASVRPVADLQGVTVLLVEDDDDTRRALAALLTTVKATVLACDAVPAALDQYDAAQPDVIVSDIGLAQMDGNAFLREVRRREIDSGSRPVPAVALTAFAGEEDRRRAIEAGFHIYHSKPVDPDELLSALVDLLERA